jgi:hypothetical protein
MDSLRSEIDLYLEDLIAGIGSAPGFAALARRYDWPQSTPIVELHRAVDLLLTGTYDNIECDPDQDFIDTVLEGLSAAGEVAKYVRNDVESRVRHGQPLINWLALGLPHEPSLITLYMQPGLMIGRHKDTIRYHHDMDEPYASHPLPVPQEIPYSARGFLVCDEALAGLAGIFTRRCKPEDLN